MDCAFDIVGRNYFSIGFSLLGLGVDLFGSIEFGLVLLLLVTASLLRKDWLLHGSFGGLLIGLTFWLRTLV